MLRRRAVTLLTNPQSSEQTTGLPREFGSPTTRIANKFPREFCGPLIQELRTSICRGFAFSFLGNSSSRTPLRSVALIFDSSISS